MRDGPLPHGAAAHPPGEHGRDRLRQASEYNTQLREKQKARRIYGVLETQFRNMYEEASRQTGITGDNLLRMLEPASTTSCSGPDGEQAATRRASWSRHGHVA